MLQWYLEKQNLINNISALHLFSISTHFRIGGHRLGFYSPCRKLKAKSEYNQINESMGIGSPFNIHQTLQNGQSQNCSFIYNYSLLGLLLSLAVM